VGKAVAEGVSGNRRAIAVVSPNTEDGKTFFSSNLAVVFAQLGGRTLIIDADLRGPRLHQVFGVESKTGLSGLLSGRKADGAIKAVRGIPNLFVLPVGVNPPNPLELLEGPAFGLLLHELLLKFDHIVVDTPAGQYGVDGAVVAARCGAAVIVARKDKGRITDLKGTVQTLQRAAVAIAGVVYNEE
jgi:protein-tyrosine kinase